MTSNLATIPSVPGLLRGRLSRIDELEVRGEVFMPRAAFEKLNRAVKQLDEAALMGMVQSA